MRAWFTGFVLLTLGCASGQSSPQQKEVDSLSALAGAVRQEHERAIRELDSLSSAWEASQTWAERFDSLQSGRHKQPFTIELQDALSPSRRPFLLIGRVRDMWRTDTGIVVRLTSTRPRIEGVVFDLTCGSEVIDVVKDRRTTRFDYFETGVQYAVVATYTAALPGEVVPSRVDLGYGDESADVTVRPSRAVTGKCLALKRVGYLSALNPTYRLAEIEKQIERRK